MKKVISISMSIIMLLCMIATTTIMPIASAENTYTLIWSDEFNGASLNPYNWCYDTGIRNGEKQRYSPNNVSVHDGYLDIIGKGNVVDSDKTNNAVAAGVVGKHIKDCSSGSIIAGGKQNFRYGYWEVRAKLTNACSSWPAFWTCGWDKDAQTTGAANWPLTGEIDYMEMMCVNSNNEKKSPSGKTNTDKEYGVHLHYGLKEYTSPGNCTVYQHYPKDPGSIWTKDGKQLAEKWHTYGMLWNENSIKITMDGEVRLVLDTSPEALANNRKIIAFTDKTGKKWTAQEAKNAVMKANPFNAYEQYPIINLAIGGSGTESRFYSDEWPQHLLVDYIRIYQDKSNSKHTYNATINSGNLSNGQKHNVWKDSGYKVGEAIPTAWVKDPLYGGKQTEETQAIVGVSTAVINEAAAYEQKALISTNAGSGSPTVPNTQPPTQPTTQQTQPPTQPTTQQTQPPTQPTTQQTQPPTQPTTQQTQPTTQPTQPTTQQTDPTTQQTEPTQSQPTTSKTVSVIPIPTLEDNTSQTSTVVADYATQLEYDNSPMTVGQTRAVRFYHPQNQTVSPADISEVSDNISYQYEEGSDTVYITALKAGKAKMYIREGDCAFGAYVNIDIVDAPTTTTTTATGLLGDCDLDGNINSFDIMLMKRALVNSEFKDALMNKGDMNKDGELNSFDIMLIKKVILELKQ